MLSQYYTPTNVLLGKNAEMELAAQLNSFGAKKVLLVFGGGSAKKSGLLDRVELNLTEAGIKFSELGGVQANPRISLVRKGIEMYTLEELDFIVAVGGGSVIDTAKAIGYGVYNKGDVWDFYCGKRQPAGSAPVGAILTIAAAGSEMSDSSVLTNEEGNLKRGCNSNYCRLKFALLNPELTMSVSDFQTSCGTVDIMMHTLERFFHSGDSFELTDALAIASLKTVIKYGSILHRDGRNYEARANMMWASSLSHNGLYAAGNPTKGDWACHQLEHELSGMFDIAHGAGLAIVFPAWASYVCSENYSRFSYLGRELFSIEGQDDKSVCEKTIDAFKTFFSSLGMPVSLRELNITLSSQQMEELLDKATFYGRRTLGDFKVLHREDMKAIYENCK